MAFQLSLILLLVTVALGAVQQSSPEQGVGGFLADRLYMYQYSSVASVYHSTNITLQAKVRLDVDVGKQVIKMECLHDSLICKLKSESLIRKIESLMVKLFRLKHRENVLLVLF